MRTPNAHSHGPPRAATDGDVAEATGQAHNGRTARPTDKESDMAVTEINDAELDAYLSMPDCPQCGSDDVECTDSYSDGLGGIVRVYYCSKCGHTWTEAG